LHELGNVAYLEGKTKEARRYYEQALDINRRSDDELGAGYCLGSLSVLAFDAGDHAEAWDLVNQAIEIGRRYKDADLVVTAIEHVSAFFELPEYQAKATELRAGGDSLHHLQPHQG